VSEANSPYSRALREAIVGAAPRGVLPRYGQPGTHHDRPQVVANRQSATLAVSKNPHLSAVRRASAEPRLAIAWALAVWLTCPRLAHSERDVPVIGGNTTERGELAALASSPAIDVTSEPLGADVHLDRAPAGKTPTRPEQTFAVGFTLRAEPPPAALQPGTSPKLAITKSRSFRLIPAAAIVSGTGLVAFGGVALYLGQLGGPTERYVYTRATPVGVASIVLGLGAIVTGFYFWRGPDGSGLFSAVDRHSSIFVWSGRF
jgi:hypothetical protein